MRTVLMLPDGTQLDVAAEGPVHGIKFDTVAESGEFHVIVDGETFRVASIHELPYPGAAAGVTLFDLEPLEPPPT